MILLEIATREMPNYGYQSDDGQFMKDVKKGVRPAIPKDIPPIFKEIMDKTWVQNPKQRPAVVHLVSQLKKWCLENPTAS